MTYTAVDQSVQDGNPVLLFDFAQEASNWRYSNIAADITYNSNLYSAVPVMTDQVVQTSEISKSQIKITLPRDNALALVMLADPGDAPVTVTILRGHVDDNNYVTAWKGRVASSTVSGDKISMDCEPIFTSMKRPGLRARYQKTCRHALYQRGCGLSDSSFADAATANSISNLTVTLASDPSGVTGYYIGGMIEYGGVKRFVANHSGTTLTLLRSFEDLQTAISGSGPTAVTLYPGCDHTTTTCESRFNNILNYGGFPYIPRKNPMGGSSII